MNKQTGAQLKAKEVCEKVFDALCLDLDWDGVLSDSRYAELVWQRVVVCMILRKSGMGLSEIGRIINNHHATVIHLLTKYDWSRGYAKASRSKVNAVINKNSRVSLNDKIKYLQEEITNLQRELTRLKS